jgi:thioredoxin reductase (NADPH)
LTAPGVQELRHDRGTGKRLEMPVILVVDADGPDRAKLMRDLDRRFGAELRILGAGSAKTALTALAELASAGTEVVLVLAADALPESPGLQFLAQAHELHPTAKRVLLVDHDYTGRNPVVHALTLGQIDFHLGRPWFPERTLYPTVTECLAERDRTRMGRFQVLKIVGRPWDPRSHELRETLARVGIPYGFYSADSEVGRQLLTEAGQDGSRLPVLLTLTGRAFVEPTHSDVIQSLGGQTHPEARTYDLAILGAGPAGLAAAMYAASEGLSTIVIEPEVFGGQAGTSARIRNYLGFPRGISGDELAFRGFEQAWLFGASFVFSQKAVGIAARGSSRILTLSDGSEVEARAVIVATGASWRRLGVPALEALSGAGVFYGAAAAEVRAAEGRPVYVVGGGNSAGQAAFHLSRYATSVTVLVMEPALDNMSDYLIRELETTPNIEVRTNTEVIDGGGRGRLESLTLRDRLTGATESMAAEALFVLIGARPRTEWLDGAVERDDRGYILTGRDLLLQSALPATWPLQRPPLLLETSLPGVFAVGDVRYGSVKRVATAVGEGSSAVQRVHEYLGHSAAVPLGGYRPESVRRAAGPDIDAHPR